MTAGQVDWTILSAHVTASQVHRGQDGQLPRMEFRAGGLVAKDSTQFSANDHNEHFHYPVLDLSVGDVITVEIIETSETDSPQSRIRRPAPNADGGTTR